MFKSKKYALMLFILFWGYSALGTSCLSFTQAYSLSRYRLSEKAKKHIFEGEIVSSGPSKTPKIKGGLHTAQALEKFVALRPDISNIHDFAESKSKDWYHLSHSDSGVIYARLPESAYTKASLKNLWSSDIHLKNGYLWKTLFPANMSPTDIESAIDAILKKPKSIVDRGWALSVTGFHQIDGLDPFEVTLVLNQKDGEVISAYPSFTQQNSSLTHKNFLSLQKHSIISEVINPNFIDEAIPEMTQNSTAGPIEKAMETLQTFKKFIDNESLWNSFDDQTQNTYLQKLFGSADEIDGSNISTVDIVLTFSKISPGYKRGDAFKIYFAFLERLLKNKKFDQLYKYQVLKKLINAAYINDFTSVIDILWAKHLINTVLKFEYFFEKHIFENLIRTVHESPISWTLLINTEEGFFTVSDPMRFSIVTLNDLSGHLLNTTDYKKHKVESEQLELVAENYPIFRKNWQSEFTFIEKLVDLPEFQPGGAKQDLAYKLVGEYANALSLRAFFLEHRIGGLFLEKKSIATAFDLNIGPLKWKNIRKRFLKAMKILKKYNSQFPVTKFIPLFDLTIYNKTGIYFYDKFILKQTVKKFITSRLKNLMTTNLNQGTKGSVKLPQLILENQDAPGLTIVEMTFTETTQNNSD